MERACLSGLNAERVQNPEESFIGASFFPAQKGAQQPEMKDQEGTQCRAKVEGNGLP